jgi:small subunit ribosomal protein S20
MAKLKTGRHTSSLKAVRSSSRKRRLNLSARKKAKEVIKELQAAIQAKNAAQVKDLLPKAMSSLKKMGNRRQVNPTAASRKIGRLSRAAHKALTVA